MQNQFKNESKNKYKIASAFDRAARHYDEVANFQQRVGIRLAHHYLLDAPSKIQSLNTSVSESLSKSTSGPKRDSIILPHAARPQISPAINTATILDGGCGTAYHHPLLRAHRPDATIIAFDLSAAMLQQAAVHDVRCVCGDLESLPFDTDSFSLIWSSLALQWCRAERTYPELQRTLKPHGTLVFSTLLTGTLHEFETAFHDVDGRRHVRAFSTEQTLIAALRAAGFKNIQYTVEHWITLHADFQSLLASIREIGASRGNVVSSSNSAPNNMSKNVPENTANDTSNESGQHRRGMMGKNTWKAMQSAYEALRTEQGYLPASYKVLFVRATK